MVLHMVLGVPHTTDLMPDSTQQPSERDLYTCGICGKTFERRDLRDRHKRRCLRSISNPRRSKQKSCCSCATSKLSCDLRLPSCSRCALRNISCEYVSRTGSREEKRTAGESENLSDAIDQTVLALESSSAAMETDVHNHAHSSLHAHLQVDDVHAKILPSSSHRPSEPVRSGLQSPLSELSDSPTPQGSMNSSTAQASDISSNHITNEELTRTWANIENFQQFLNADTGLETAVAETETMALSPGYQVPSAQSPFQINGTAALFEGFNNQWLSANLANFQQPNEHDWGDSLPDFSIEPSRDFGFNLMGSFGIPGSYTPTNSFQKMVTDCPGSSFTTPSWKPPLRPEMHEYADKVSEDELSLVLRDGPPSVTPARPIDGGINAPDRNQQVPTFCQGREIPSYPFNGTSYPLNSNKVLTNILLEFPQMMARPGGKYPPFVHHKIYRCEEGDVLKPLAVSFCFVTALNAAFPSGKAFVHSLMNAERDRLLKGFRLLRDSELDMMAALHALCVYQIIGFFDDSSPDSARLTELQQPFFLRMTRRLVASYMPQLRSPYDNTDYSEAVWAKWTAMETFRRTFFLVHIINVISCRTEKQNPYFYEELDDDLVMNLPLPAPEKVWRASSAAEWKAALEEELQGGWQANRTAGTVLGGEGWKEDGVNGVEWEFGGGGGAGRGLNETAFASSHEFTRLLLHCIDKRRGG